jgi:carbonic anhydrase
VTDDKILFATAISCIDGRVQDPTSAYLKRKYGITYLDRITEAGPAGILAQMTNYESINSIRRLVDISVHRHGSRHIAVIGHHDCAGNPVNADTHRSHIQSAVQTLRVWYPDITVIGLWINGNWTVEEL